MFGCNFANELFDFGGKALCCICGGESGKILKYSGVTQSMNRAKRKEEGVWGESKRKRTLVASISCKSSDGRMRGTRDKDNKKKRCEG